jgi:hypothetical protein
MKWNPFGKNKQSSDSASDAVAPSSVPGMPDPSKMGMLERIAYNRFLKMSPAEREKVMKKALTPKNVEKHKDEILASLEAMRKSRQISDDQYRLAKAKFGLK